MKNLESIMKLPVHRTNKISGLLTREKDFVENA
jgi:hypothetical protein